MTHYDGLREAHNLATQQERLQILNSKRTPHQKRVNDFMLMADQEVPDGPTVPDVQIRKLRSKLIMEEALETIVGGLGCSLVLQIKGVKFRIDSTNIDDLEVHPVRDGVFNMEETIDGCCDIKVVTTGTLSACGIPDAPFQMEVDQNNLAKFGPGGYRREDGKWIKPPDHKPPKIKEILKQIEDRCMVEKIQKLGDTTLIGRNVHVDEKGETVFPAEPEITPVLDGPGKDIPLDVKLAMDVRNYDAEKKERQIMEEKLVKSKFGTFLVMHLDSEDEIIAHAARQAARLFKKLIWHDEKHKRLANEIGQQIIAIEELLPPLKRTDDAQAERESQNIKT